MRRWSMIGCTEKDENWTRRESWGPIGQGVEREIPKYHSRVIVLVDTLFPPQ